jgi:small conductance mechanosensitive channel
MFFYLWQTPIAELNKAYSYIDDLGTMIIHYAPKVLLAAIMLYVGFFIINKSVNGLQNMMRRNGFDNDLRPFLLTLANLLLKLLLFLSVAEVVGIQTTSFIAVLAAAGFAVGLALQGSLSNLAGGILILLFKPFKTGDLIRTQSLIGFVKEIQILNTILSNPQNHRIVIPNSLITTGVIENLTGAGVIRVDINIGVSYSSAIEQVHIALKEVIANCPMAAAEKEHSIQLRNFGASSLDFSLCIWTEGKNYFDIQWYLNEEIKKSFDKFGIQIPFPQMDVHFPQP